MDSKNNKDDSTVESEERRRFLSATSAFGFTTAVVAAGAGTLMSKDALAFTAKEEKERKDSAKFEMIIGTQSTLGSSRAWLQCSWILKRIYKISPTVISM